MSAGSAFIDRLVAELERKERPMAIREETHQDGRMEMRIVVARASRDRPLVREVERPGFWARAWRALFGRPRSRAHVPRLLGDGSPASRSERERLALERDNPWLMFRQS